MGSCLLQSKDMTELLELKSKLERSIEQKQAELDAKQAELKTVTEALEILRREGGRQRAQTRVPPAWRNHMSERIRRQRAMLERGEVETATLRDIMPAIHSMRGEFKASEITQALEPKFPNDSRLAKKVARVLYSLRKKGKLEGHEVEIAGHKRFIYRLL